MVGEWEGGKDSGGAAVAQGRAEDSCREGGSCGLGSRLRDRMCSQGEPVGWVAALGVEGEEEGAIKEIPGKW